MGDPFGSSFWFLWGDKRNLALLFKHLATLKTDAPLFPMWTSSAGTVPAKHSPRLWSGSEKPVYYSALLGTKNSSITVQPNIARDDAPMVTLGVHA